MAQVFGKKSEYLIKNEKRAYSSSLASALSLFPLAFLSFIQPLFIFPFLFVKSKGEKLLKRSDKFYNGRHGEYDVCDELQKLPDSYLIFQDVNLDNMRGNIDFVVVGPTGICAIEVKSQRGKIDSERLNKESFLKQAMNEAMNIHEYLGKNTGKDFFVTPILVFSRASVRFGLAPINKVYVVGKKWLNELVLSGKDKLFPEEIKMLKNELLKVVKI